MYPQRYGQIFELLADAEVDTITYDWFTDNVREYTGEETIRKFTRLYIGATVATSGGRCFKRLTT